MGIWYVYDPILPEMMEGDVMLTVMCSKWRVLTASILWLWVRTRCMLRPSKLLGEGGVGGLIDWLFSRRVLAVVLQWSAGCLLLGHFGIGAFEHGVGNVGIGATSHCIREWLLFGFRPA